MRAGTQHRLAGVVKWFDADKGSGVITSPRVPGGCFVHFSSLQADSFRALSAGSRVEFTYEETGSFLQDGCRSRLSLSCRNAGCHQGTDCLVAASADAPWPRSRHTGEVEIRLDGGNAGGAVRVGDTVRRAGGPWTPSVHALLAHLSGRGFAGSPRPLGIDEQGREVLTFLAGETVGSGVADGRPVGTWVDHRAQRRRSL